MLVVPPDISASLQKATPNFLMQFLRAWCRFVTSKETHPGGALQFFQLRDPLDYISLDELKFADTVLWTN